MKYLLILTLLLAPSFASAMSYEDAYRLLYIIQLEKRQCVFQDFRGDMRKLANDCLTRSLTRRQTKSVYIPPASFSLWNDGRVFGGVLLSAGKYESERTRLYDKINVRVR